MTTTTATNTVTAGAIGAARRPASRAQAVAALGLSTVLSAAVVVSSIGVDTDLGAPVHWTWVLTALQVCALWAAGGERRWGWYLGAAVQPAWIAYAFMTGQLGFVPGCLVSGVVQAVNAVRHAPSS